MDRHGGHGEGTAVRRARGRRVAACVLLAAGLWCGCMSLATHTAILSDASHTGTPYAGARGDAHTLLCFGRDVMREPSGLLFAPLVLLPLVDLPLSFALDTLLLPIDVPLEPARPPLRVGEGGCRLVGM